MSENDKQDCQPVATKQSNNENKKVRIKKLSLNGPIGPFKPPRPCGAGSLGTSPLLIHTFFPFDTKVFPLVTEVFPLVTKVFTLVTKIFPLVTEAFPLVTKVIVI